MILPAFAALLSKLKAASPESNIIPLINTELKDEVADGFEEIEALAGDISKLNSNIYEKEKQIEENECMYESFMMEDAEYCVVAFGIASRVAKSAIVEARKQGIKVGMIRPITLWPFPKKAFRKAADQVKAFISVELSMGQMIDDIRLAEECIRPVYLCNRAGGVIPTTEDVMSKILEANKIGGAN